MTAEGRTKEETGGRLRCFYFELCVAVEKVSRALWSQVGGAGGRGGGAGEEGGFLLEPLYCWLTFQRLNC